MFLILPLLVACSQDAPPVDEADLAMSETPDMAFSPDMSEAPDLAPSPDMGEAPDLSGPTAQTFTWNEVNGWYVLRSGTRVCGPYAVDAGTPPTVDSILRRFCTEQGFPRYTVGCSVDTLQSALHQKGPEWDQF